MSEQAIINNWIDDNLLESFLFLNRFLFNKNVILLGGSSLIDSWRPTEQEKQNQVFVQLNHHIFRREHQPCDWLICRQGSGMLPDVFEDLRDWTKTRIKIISPQISRPEYFVHWIQKPYTIFPFFEKAHKKLNPYHPAFEWCNSFWNEILTNPFIGILAVKMILLFPIQSLTLKGFDFFTNSNQDIPRRVGCHYVKTQTEYLINLYQSDYRIHLEPDLLKLLQVEKRERFLIYDADK